MGRPGGPAGRRLRHPASEAVLSGDAPRRAASIPLSGGGLRCGRGCGRAHGCHRGRCASTHASRHGCAHGFGHGRCSPPRFGYGPRSRGEGLGHPSHRGVRGGGAGGAEPTAGLRRGGGTGQRQPPWYVQSLPRRAPGSAPSKSLSARHRGQRSLRGRAPGGDGGPHTVIATRTRRGRRKPGCRMPRSSQGRQCSQARVGPPGAGSLLPRSERHAPRAYG